MLLFISAWLSVYINIIYRQSLVFFLNKDWRVQKNKIEENKLQINLYTLNQQYKRKIKRKKSL